MRAEPYTVSPIAVQGLFSSPAPGHAVMQGDKVVVVCLGPNSQGRAEAEAATQDME